MAAVGGLKDKPGLWIACSKCMQHAEPRLLSEGLTEEQLLRYLHLRGWRGTTGADVMCPACANADTPPLVPDPPAPYASPSRRRFNDCFELYQRTPSREHGRDLQLAVTAHMQSGTATRSDVGPCIGAMTAIFRKHNTAHLFGRIAYALWCVYICFVKYIWPWRGIAAWNDFEMAGWLLTHDMYYTRRIYKRLTTTRGMVASTCSWMVESVRQQEPEFNAQWIELLQEHLTKGMHARA